jgi:hypothetical protein
MLALGLKLWVNPDAEFTFHSCALEDGRLDKDGACSNCHVRDLADCKEKKDDNVPRPIQNEGLQGNHPEK